MNLYVVEHTFLTTIPPRLWAMKIRGLFLDYYFLVNYIILENVAKICRTSAVFLTILKRLSKSLAKLSIPVLDLLKANPES
jgi:hypothetical protein